MAKAPDTAKSAATGLALIRIFLGLFFLFAATAKLVPLEDLANSTVAPVPPVVAPEQTVADPPVVTAQPFIDELKQATGENGIFSSKDNILPEYAAFLQKTVSPNAVVFGWMIVIAEALIGFLLLIGLLTRLTATVAMLLSAAYLLATMHLFPPVGLAGNAAFLAMELAVLVGNAGKVGGVDALLGKKKAKKPEE